ncbi:MAG: hypothetical protein M1839_001603 [Geoglossum umbratile]|nr:MAG: hypothetical protein M1839_001603 [Geoglossum umbratile]
MENAATNSINSVDFWFFSFSFDFGATAQGPPPINLQDFYLLCEKSGPPDTSPNSSATDGLTVKIKMSLEDGSFPMPSEDKNSGAPPDDTGAGTKWFVKGGSFQFRVSSVFAITQAYVETEDSSQRQPDGTTALLGQQDTSKMQQVKPAPSQSKLSSLPMQLSADLAHLGGDGISSKMCIAIQDVDEKGLAIEGFKPSFIVKAMPQTLWADPNHPPDRLTQDKGTVDLPMAVTFSAPDPVLSIAKIPQFNATDMAKECAGGNRVPQLPTVTQQDLLPEALPTTTSTPTQQWASMKQTWSDSSNNNLTLANNLTQLCMETLGWDKPPPDVLEKAKGANIEPWMVPVAFPSRLVAGTGREAQGIEDGLDSFYLELPRTTVAPVH